MGSMGGPVGPSMGQFHTPPVYGRMGHPGGPMGQSAALDPSQAGLSPIGLGNPGSPQIRMAYYESHWPLYGLDWTYHDGLGADLVATSSFSEDQNNKIQVIQANHDTADSTNFQFVAESAVAYPPTKIRWEPSISGGGGGAGTSARMISTGDCLRLWDYDGESSKLMQRCALLNKPKSEYMPPLTSFDWNTVNPSLVVTSSIDTTCTIWDIATSCARTQLIAHDSEVYDVSFVAHSVDVFASVGADGSVRVFDLRSLDHSTIIYEPTNPVPLLRIAANPFDPNILATVAYNSSRIHILDIRVPGVPLTTLDGHTRPVNSIVWAPGAGKNGYKRHILASSGDDCQVLLWDVTDAHSLRPDGTSNSNTNITNNNNPTSNLNMSNNNGGPGALNQATSPMPPGTTISSKSVPKTSPMGSYTDNLEVNNITWSPNADWLGIASGRGIQAVRFS